MKTAFCLIFLGLAGEVNAQVGNLLQARYDTASVVELFNEVPIGFIFPGNPGGATRGWLRGRIGWGALAVTTPQGRVTNGMLVFDRARVWRNNHRVSFRVTYRGHTYTTDMMLPYVTSLYFNLFTDSLKKDNPFDLNVQGRFTSHKVYPLDTGMVAFTKTGGGTLSAGRLVVTGDDTVTRKIHVVVRLKADPSIADSVWIPVKQIPDTARLPSEQELLDQWKRRGRR